jgi:hypothetical protein
VSAGGFGRDPTAARQPQGVPGHPGVHHLEERRAAPMCLMGY